MATNRAAQRVSVALTRWGRTDPNNLRTRFDYHHAAQDGALKSTTLPQVSDQAQGRVTEITSYDGNGQPLRINHIAADGSVRDTYRFYDELGRVTRELGPPTSASDGNRPVRRA